jgi:D-arabinose 1-dehydrogenase-like Zn-dependent alcohol dehydrogenase
MKGKAAIFTDVGKPLEFREYALPDVEAGAMLVKISMANICGSDLHFLRGQGPGIPRGIPQVLGHEMTGRIARLGRQVKTDAMGQPLHEGDRVVYAYFRGCGTCWMCLTGMPGCPQRYAHWIGVSSELPPHFNGAYAEYYYLRPGQWVFKVPDELPDQLISPVNCALAEVLYGLHKTGIVLGDSVVIQGAGGLGLYAAAVAREMGAGPIIVLDKMQDRLELAKAFGADHVINVEALDWPQRLEVVKQLTDGRGADVVAEFVGSPAVVQEGLEMLRYGGRYLWIGNINL